MEPSQRERQSLAVPVHTNMKTRLLQDVGVLKCFSPNAFFWFQKPWSLQCDEIVKCVEFVQVIARQIMEWLYSKYPLTKIRTLFTQRLT